MTKLLALINTCWTSNNSNSNNKNKSIMAIGPHLRTCEVPHVFLSNLLAKKNSCCSVDGDNDLIVSRIRFVPSYLFVLNFHRFITNKKPKNKFKEQTNGTENLIKYVGYQCEPNVLNKLNNNKEKLYLLTTL